MSTNFIRQIIEADLEAGRRSRVVTRFPPEPNGFLHIGHAKSICLNFGLAEQYGGSCYLRFDDTNPVTEEQQYIEAIIEDVRWLGFDWPGEPRYASDYFEAMYAHAVALIEQGLAYVDDQSAEQVRANRGTLTEPGRESPCRERPAAESLELFARMRDGELPAGTRVLRAKIDMAAPNLNLRDPVMYRILDKPHHRTGSRWHVYPTYDWAHGLEDSIEGVTHSICTLEFEDHRPLYDWYLDRLGIHHPQQIEFARLNLDHTVMSKRLLNRLVAEGHVAGWDDPRLPTLAGLRRRGCPPAAIRDFCERIGVTKKDTVIELSLLESCIREELDRAAPRRMAVLKPLKLTIRSYPQDEVEYFEAANHPARPELGSRQVAFSRELYIERDDFMEDPPRKFFRLAPGREVRLRYAYLVTCVDFIRDPATGEVVEVICEHDPASRGGAAPDGRKVKGTIHWVCARASEPAEVRLYDRLFAAAEPGGAEPLAAQLNPDSLITLAGARVEPALGEAATGEPCQFERLGYFCADADSRGPGTMVFNRTVGLRDSWAKAARS